MRWEREREREREGWVGGRKQEERWVKEGVSEKETNKKEPSTPLLTKDPWAQCNNGGEKSHSGTHFHLARVASGVDGYLTPRCGYSVGHSCPKNNKRTKLHTPGNHLHMKVTWVCQGTCSYRHLMKRWHHNVLQMLKQPHLGKSKTATYLHLATGICDRNWEKGLINNLEQKITVE